jgi:rubrerythrin
MATAENLKEAFAGESQANRKHLAFARKAEAGGNQAATASFRNALAVEQIHHGL